LILLNSSIEKICSFVSPNSLICSPNRTERIVSVPSSRTMLRRARFTGLISGFCLSSSVSFLPVSGWTSKYLGSNAWTITALVWIVCPGWTWFSFFVGKTCSSIGFSIFSLLGFISANEER